MIKTIFSDSQPELLSKVASMMTIIESGKHIKEASSGIGRELLEGLKPDSDHYLIHLIALGDHETYGFNRNGDTFTKDACIRFHDTFVKKACYYREHANKDQKKRIGDVKASCYNPELKRIELAIWGKKAAAPDIWESIKEGSSRSYSMACKVKYDVSSITDKRQPTVMDYDEYCRDRMTQWIPEHEKYAFVFNPEPEFFDISDVENPADRIAHFLAYEFEKAAGMVLDAKGNRAQIPSAKFASLFLDEDQMAGANPLPPGYLEVLQKLATAEKYLNLVRDTPDMATDGKMLFVKTSCVNANMGQLTDAQIKGFRTVNPDEFFEALAKRAAIIPFVSFCAYVDGETVEDTLAKPEVKCAMDTIENMFEGMVEEPMGDMAEIFNFSGPIEYDQSKIPEVVDFIEMCEREFSITPQIMQERALKVAYTGVDKPVKQASSEPFNEEVKIKASVLTQAYGLYKISTIIRIKEIFGSNFIDEAQYLLLSSQNRNH